MNRLRQSFAYSVRRRVAAGVIGSAGLAASTMALLLSIANAQAQTSPVLSAPSWSGQIDIGGIEVLPSGCGGFTNIGSQSITGSGTFSKSATSCYGASGTGAAVLQDSPNPSISLSAGTSAVLSPYDGIEAESNAQLTYEFQVDGPTPSVELDEFSHAGVSNLTAEGVNATLSFVVDAGAGGDTIGTLSVAGGPRGSLSYSGAGIQPGFDPNSFTMNTAITVPTGSPIFVDIEASVGIEAGAGYPPLTESAYLDPYFTIDPSVPNADEYSIFTSPGIGNSPISGVPEPSTWAMMLLGFAGLGSRVIATCAGKSTRPERAISPSAREARAFWA
jgi:hypothetical protein